ncbi:type II secretion system protein [Armatimonas rosea]|uniref:Prepilin-type N-terminal cleavage/methylation domain-containing protein n=1 Tax=Armatimonas rosea TaxID=685828 RepID=A0A7W9SKI9_ARMRO|nr:prepilin-type N-terminal cleavage/methylation domain-containing protein [Armatimonas rosea]MBB6048306.1 prepilin-type N-terminal cleavage/methylation domain-containing protein [Armatimonas rosea]
MTSNLRVRNYRAAFTLIELLVVIAIIAILAAILFPVAGTVQESARRGATMSNLQKIHQAISAYELDNREYPEFLFGPAICRTNGLPDPSCSDFYTMKETAALVTGRYRSTDPEYVASRNARKIFTKSLYPEYIRDLDTFQSRNNVVATPSVTGKVGLASRISLLNPAGPTFYVPRTAALGLGAQQIPFYAYDAFDASPLITNINNNTIDNNTLVARYSRLWMPVVDNTTLDSLSPANLQLYQRQLLWARPPADTVVTMTTHHVPKGKILVLFQSGTAKVLDVRKLSPLPANPAGDSQFWQLTN